MRYLAFFLALLLYSCTKSGENEDLSANQSKWEKNNTGNYSYTLTIGCYCTEAMAGPHVIKVVDDTIYSVNDQAYDPSTMSYLMTIDELFAWIRTSIDRNPYKKYITFNQVYGYPEHAGFDFEKTMVDEEISYNISGFVKN
jgi:hypothetical protein